MARCGAGRDEQRRGTVCVPHTRGCAHETQSDRGQRTAPQSGRRQHERRGTECMVPAGVQGSDGARDGMVWGGVQRRGRNSGRLGPG